MGSEETCLPLEDHSYNTEVEVENEAGDGLAQVEGFAEEGENYCSHIEVPGAWRADEVG